MTRDQSELIWDHFFISPDKTKVCVVGHYPGIDTGCLVFIFDYTYPDKKPYKELYRGCSDDLYRDFQITGWKDNETLTFAGDQVEYRKSDEKLKRLLSEKEADILDDDFRNKMEYWHKKLEAEGRDYWSRTPEEKEEFKNSILLGFTKQTLTGEMKIDTLNCEEDEDKDCWKKCLIHGIDENGCLINKG